NCYAYFFTFFLSNFTVQRSSLVKTAYITVFENPIANFSSTPETVTLFDPIIYFTDLSQFNIVAWNWSFNELGFSNIQHPNFTFPDVDTGSYLIKLSVENTNGCRDSIAKYVKIHGESGIFIPNAFSPDGDNLNETFSPKGFGITDENYSFLIFNRWGELIFESHKLDDGWDGTYKKTLVEVGVYVWKLNYKDINGKTWQYTGKVTIIK
ncbi:MAG: hypothetical protein CVT95_09270, partial [Bacteroidetes bacterium HGW-Bacteroidetes-12]